jgi:hypothetical protein
MMAEPLQDLIHALLYEGYALYPYTPDATKNATPTPFGIVYPPIYAAECEGAFDHARLECLAVPAPRARLSATLRYLSPSGERHQAAERQVDLGPVEIGERDTVQFEGGRLTLRSEPEPGGRVLVRCCVHNTVDVPAGLGRAAALAESLISTHIVIRVSAGRFVSPLLAGRESVNIWPVLVTDSDDTVLGAAIALPDHPQVSPDSRGNLFDNTEIEEALVLHVHALTDDEREQAGGQDPVVREMLERALAVTPEEIIGLHSGLRADTNGGPHPDALDGGQADRFARRPPEPPSLDDGAADNPGELEATVDGVTFTRGAKLILKPGTDRDVYDRILDGRAATIERIYLGYDDRVYLGVTIDDDPGQQLMRETGRYLFFFANEVEPL